MKKRVFSGIQPSGSLHVGNFLGAIRRWVESQAECDNIFCIVDLHAITMRHDPAALSRNIRESAGLLLAAGIDPDASALFVQSRVSAHAELAWILNCLVPMGWLERMTQFKDKARDQRERASAGLFDYPVLMAADILLYETDLVPVGEDQRQHVELARDIARRFNSMYGETFKVPEAVVPRVGARIMGLDDPTKKMSKSEPKEGHAIHLLDPPDAIRRKVMQAQTDSLRDIRFDETRPGIFNLLVMYELFTGLDRAAIESRFEGKGYANFKTELAEAVIEGLRPLQSRYRALVKEPDRLESLLAAGTAKVRPAAEKVLDAAKRNMGLA